MSESIKRGKFTYRKVGGHYVRIPPEDPPRTYHLGLKGEILTVPLIAPVRGGSVSSRMPPVALRMPPYIISPSESDLPPPEMSSDEEAPPPPPRRKKVKKEVPRVIRGVNPAGEETDTEYEYKAPRKRKPLASNVVVPKKSKSVQTTSKMAATVVEIKGVKSSSFRYYPNGVDDTTDSRVVKLTEAEDLLGDDNVQYVKRRAGARKHPKGTVSGGRGVRLDKYDDVLAYDRGLANLTKTYKRKYKGVTSRSDAKIIPASHIRLLARKYGLGSADVHEIIKDMDDLALTEVKTRGEAFEAKPKTVRVSKPYKKTDKTVENEAVRARIRQLVKAR